MSFSQAVFKRSTKEDHFLREGNSTRRFIKQFRQKHVVLRCATFFAVGFTIGALVEVFVCKTHLYEAVMVKKENRRHEMDEFVVDFRRNIEKWQRQDMLDAQRRRTGATSQ